MFLFTRAFWVYAGDRVVKSFGQAILAANLNEQIGFITVDSASQILGGALVYSLLSLCTAMVAFPDVLVRDEPEEPEEGEAEGVENQRYFEDVKRDLAGSHRAADAEERTE